MKRAALLTKLLCLTFALALCLPLLLSCNKEPDPQPSVPEQTTDADTSDSDTAEPDTTEPDTTESDSSAQDTTEEATTEAPAPVLTTSLHFAEVSNELDLSKYFTGAYQCKATLAEDGTLCLGTANTPSSIASSDPYIYLKLAALIKAMGYEAPDTREYPHMVLRVRSENRTGNIFSMFGYSSKNPSGTGITGQLDRYLDNSEEWQYLYFDLSSYSKNLISFRFDLTTTALANGEALYISDITFYATAEEATALLSPDVYPITDQSAEDYVAKIISFNVQTENGTQVRPDIRMDMLRDLMDEYQPDSIGMQEVTTKWREMMDSYAFNQSYAGVGEARTPGGEANPIYYRTDKFELVDSGTFWLSDTPDVQGSQFAESLYVRICTWAHLRDKVTGKEYVHVNTHLDNLGSSEGRTLRKQQITVILKFLQRFGDIPMVLTGDLNQAAVNAEGTQYSVYKTLVGINAFKLDDGTKVYSPFSNARYDAPDNMPEGISATMTQYYDESGTKYNPAKEPIDYVLYTGASLTALSYKIRLYDRGGVYLSDHLPVICEIKFAPAPTSQE